MRYTLHCYYKRFPERQDLRATHFSNVLAKEGITHSIGERSLIVYGLKSLSKAKQLELLAYFHGASNVVVKDLTLNEVD